MKIQPSTLTNNRRVFMMQAIVGCAAVGTALQAKAQAALAETDPQAVALGYKADATKVDKTKQPKYAAGQVCTNCALFQGAASAAAGAGAGTTARSRRLGGDSWAWLFGGLAKADRLVVTSAFSTAAAI